MAGRYSRNNNNNYSQNNEDFDEGEMWGVFDNNNTNSYNNIYNNKEMKINIRKQPMNNNNDNITTNSTTSPRMFTAVTTPRLIPRSSQIDCGGKKQSSAPLDIPDWSKIYGKSSRKTKNGTSSSSSQVNFPNDDDNNNNNNNNNNGCYYYNNGRGDNEQHRYYNGYNNHNNNNGYNNSSNGQYDRTGHEDEDDDEDDDDIDGMVPPHEYLAKKLARNQISSFSVYEGIGRTLKGRDLSKVRNTILSKTGFLE